jgi:hypothetical protein
VLRDAQQDTMRHVSRNRFFAELATQTDGAAPASAEGSK